MRGSRRALMKKPDRHFALLAASLCFASTARYAGAQGRPATAGPTDALDKKALAGLEWRSIGPYRGGRAVAVAGVVGQPLTFYFGATGGGVFKTTDGGINWTSVSDGQ